jgi:hypothetical protein
LKDVIKAGIFMVIAWAGTIFLSVVAEETYGMLAAVIFMILAIAWTGLFVMSIFQYRARKEHLY